MQVVVDYKHRVVGIVTRKDLVKCHRLFPEWQQLLERVTDPEQIEHHHGWLPDHETYDENRMV